MSDLLRLPQTVGVYLARPLLGFERPVEGLVVVLHRQLLRYLLDLLVDWSLGLPVIGVARFRLREDWVEFSDRCWSRELRAQSRRGKLA